MQISRLRLISRSALFIVLLTISSKAFAQWEQVGWPSERDYPAALYGTEHVLFGIDYTRPTASTDGGTTWSQVFNATFPEDPRNSFLAYGNYVFAKSMDSLRRTNDFGKTWETMGAASIGDSPFLSGIVENHGQLFINVDGVGVFRSNDSGITWQRTPSDKWGNSLCAAGSYIYLFVPNSSSAYRSSDLGTTWSLACPKVALDIFSGGAVSMFSIGDSIYLTSTALYRSIDDGASWELISGLPEGAIHVYTANGLIIDGTHISKDYGRTWTDRKDNLPGPVVSSTMADGYLFAGVYHLGIWRRSVSGLTKAGVEIALTSSGVSLSSFPNPFATATTLTVDLPQTTQASIRIYDLLGREETIADNTTLTKGTHNFSWKPRVVGVYHCVLTTSSGERSVVKLVSRNE